MKRFFALGMVVLLATWSSFVESLTGSFGGKPARKESAPNRRQRAWFYRLQIESAAYRRREFPAHELPPS
jgi:hypothetical protein